MKLKYTLVLMATFSLAGCGGSSSSSPATDADQVAEENPSTTTTDDVDSDDSDEDLVTDEGVATSTDGYPSNEELAASGGVPTIDEAESLIVGSWRSVDDASQCVTIFEFDESFDFVTSSLDQRGSGQYDIFEDGSALDLSLSYLTENFQTDCLGFIADSDSLDAGVSYSYYIRFEDQNTLNFSNSSAGTRTIFSFSRQ